MDTKIRQRIAGIIMLAFIFTHCSTGLGTPIYNKVGDAQQNLRATQKAQAAGNGAGDLAGEIKNVGAEAPAGGIVTANASSEQSLEDLLSRLASRIRILEDRKEKMLNEIDASREKGMTARVQALSRIVDKITARLSALAERHESIRDNEPQAKDLASQQSIPLSMARETVALSSQYHLPAEEILSMGERNHISLPSVGRVLDLADTYSSNSSAVLSHLNNLAAVAPNSKATERLDVLTELFELAEEYREDYGISMAALIEGYSCIGSAAVLRHILEAIIYEVDITAYSRYPYLAMYHRALAIYEQRGSADAVIEVLTGESQFDGPIDTGYPAEAPAGGIVTANASSEQKTDIEALSKTKVVFTDSQQFFDMAQTKQGDFKGAGTNLVSVKLSGEGSAADIAKIEQVKSTYNPVEVYIYLVNEASKNLLPNLNNIKVIELTGEPETALQTLCDL